jgi:hypothetical protein
MALPSGVGPVRRVGVGGGVSVRVRDIWWATDSGVTSHMRPPVGPEPMTPLMAPLLAHDLSRLTGTPNRLSASLRGIRPPNSTARAAVSDRSLDVDGRLWGGRGLWSHGNAGSSDMRAG